MRSGCKEIKEGVIEKERRYFAVSIWAEKSPNPSPITQVKRVIFVESLGKNELYK